MPGQQSPGVAEMLGSILGVRGKMREHGMHPMSEKHEWSSAVEAYGEWIERRVNVDM